MSVVTRRSTLAGFTLVELAVVLAIVGVLGLIALSAGSEHKAVARGFADQVSAQLESARLRALATRRWQRVTVTEQTVVLDQATTLGAAAPIGWQPVGQLTAPGSVRVVAIEPTTVTTDQGPRAVGTGFELELRFGPDGSSLGRTLWISDRRGRSVFRIAVYRATGHARVVAGW